MIATIVADIQPTNLRYDVKSNIDKMYTGFDMNCLIRKEKIDFDNNNNKNSALPIEWNRMAGADFVQGMLSVDLLTVSFFSAIVCFCEALDAVLAWVEEYAVRPLFFLSFRLRHRYRSYMS